MLICLVVGLQYQFYPIFIHTNFTEKILLMNTFNRLLSLMFLFVFSIAHAQNDSIIDGHPAWTLRTNIYEVNVRQYTPEGTFKAFEKNLDRLKDMGVETLWFMPINPISRID